MNKIIISICALYISLIASAQVNYNINGSISGMNGKKIYLSIFLEDGSKTIIDSITVSNNSFTFKGTQPKTCFASLVGKWATIIILENGIINASLDNSKVIGTPTNDILNACQEKIKPYYHEYLTLNTQIYKCTENQKGKKAALQKKLEEISNRTIAAVKNCINQNLNNIVSAYLLRRYGMIFSDEEIVIILANVSPVIKEHFFTKGFIKHREDVKQLKYLKSFEIGEKFREINMNDVNGKNIALSDYIGKEKYVLIDFWASWCGPCRKEMSNVKAVYQKYASKGFEIVGVSLDSKKEDWLKGIKELGITWPQMSDLKGWQSMGAKTYGIKSIPSTILVDPNGIIIAKDLRGDALEKKLSELLN